jgi:hypothetical protein
VILAVWVGADAVKPRAKAAYHLGNGLQCGGGVLKELRFEDTMRKYHGLYLEAVYYTPLV